MKDRTTIKRNDVLGGILAPRSSFGTGCRGGYEIKKVLEEREKKCHVKIRDKT